MPPAPTHRPRHPALAAALLLATLAAVTSPRRAAAEEPAPAGAASLPATVTWTAGGFAAGFALHEGCHLAANLAFGHVPTLRKVSFLGAIPFFTVSPDVSCRGGACVRDGGGPFAPGPRGYGTIVAAGTICQELADEAILSARPRLREEEAPFLKGVLLFGTSVAVAYGVANLAGLEPPEGDLRSFEQVTGAPRGLLAGAVLATAALDVARYLRPDVPWLPWVSRGSKGLTIGIAVAW